MRARRNSKDAINSSSKTYRVHISCNESADTKSSNFSMIAHGTLAEKKKKLPWKLQARAKQATVRLLFPQDPCAQVFDGFCPIIGLSCAGWIQHTRSFRMLEENKNVDNKNNPASAFLIVGSQNTTAFWGWKRSAWILNCSCTVGHLDHAHHTLHAVLLRISSSLPSLLAT